MPSETEKAIAAILRGEQVPVKSRTEQVIQDIIDGKEVTPRSRIEARLCNIGTGGGSGETVNLVGSDGLFIQKTSGTTPTEKSNVIGFNDCTVTLNGMTLTITSGEITINGTATANTDLNVLSYMASDLLPIGTYTFQVEVLSGTNSENTVNFFYTGGNNVVVPTNIGYKTVTLAAAQSRAKFSVKSGAVYNNFKFHFWASVGSKPIGYVQYGTSSSATYKINEEVVTIETLDAHVADSSKHITAVEKSILSTLATDGDSVYLDEVKDTVNKIYEYAQSPCLVFNILTDSHLYPSDPQSIAHTTQTIRNIKSVREGVYSNATIHLGDLIYTQYLQEHQEMTNEEYQRMQHDYINELRGIGGELYVVNGNHDSNFDYQYNQMDIKKERFIASEWWKVGMRFNQGKVVTSGTNPYYYVDYDFLKVRCVFLSTPKDNWNKKLTAEQLKWLCTTALVVPESYKVLFFGHVSMAEFSYGNYDALSAIMTAFIGKTTYSATVDSTSLSADFTSSKNAGIIAYICGHAHGDYVVEVGSQYAVLPVPEILIGSSGYLATPDSNGLSLVKGTNFTPPCPPRMYGTITADLWDTMIYRPDLGKIYMVRFGAGSDREITI